MRLCDRHFGELRAALATCGIAAYSSKMHLDAVRRYESMGYMESGPITLERFDGVLVAYHSILELAEEAVGCDGHRYLAIQMNAICPVCSFGDAASNWLPTGAATARSFYDQLVGGHA